MKKYGNWACTAWVQKALIAVKYLESDHGDKKGFGSEMLPRTKLGPVGGNDREADLSPILQNSNNCRS